VVAEAANTIFKPQGLSASLALTTNVIAGVAKKGSLAYDRSKVVANHLVRDLAIELSPLIRANAVAPATVIRPSAQVVSQDFFAV
jgi:NAD(P)-dependent dehydrogenase (short-subunit alcohol dehydrogenase family)